MSGCRFAVNALIFPWLSVTSPGCGSFTESDWIQTNATRKGPREISSAALPRFSTWKCNSSTNSAVILFVSGPILRTSADINGRPWAFSLPLGLLWSMTKQQWSLVTDVFKGQIRSRSARKRNKRDTMRFIQPLQTEGMQADLHLYESMDCKKSMPKFILFRVSNLKVGQYLFFIKKIHFSLNSSRKQTVILACLMLIESNFKMKW